MNTLIPQKLESTLSALRHFLETESSNDNAAENVQTLTHELGNSLNIAQGFSEQIASTLQSVAQAVATMTGDNAQSTAAEKCLAQLTQAQSHMSSVLKRHEHLGGILNDMRSQSTEEEEVLLKTKWFEPIIF